jgi:hypothetical protein
MLIAAGRPNATDHDGLTVDGPDADAAVTIAGRWRADALSFASRVGETEFERIVERCRRVFRLKSPRVARRVIAQHVHLAKRTLDDVESTLVDRGEINVERIEAPGRPVQSMWELPGA